jgi:hypothetical protein
MTYKASEDSVRKALDGMDLELYVYKPPDHPGPRQNWKPCDYMVWWVDVVEGRTAFADGGSENDGISFEPTLNSTWIEVKDHPGQKGIALALWRPTQIAGMRRAKDLGLPYLTVVRWAKLHLWTIGPAALVLDALARWPKQTNIPLGAWPIQCAPAQLASHLRGAMIEGF